MARIESSITTRIRVALTRYPNEYRINLRCLADPMALAHGSSKQICSLPVVGTGKAEIKTYMCVF